MSLPTAEEVPTYYLHGTGHVPETLLDKGHLVEQGNREWLINRSSYYAKLNRYQNKTAAMRKETNEILSGTTSEGPSI